MKLIDTNVWVHALSEGSPMREKAQDITNVLMGLGEAAISIQNIIELYSAMTKTISPKEAAYWCDRFMETDAIVKLEPSKKDASDAIEAAKRLNLRRSQAFDALLAATAKNNGIKTIVTENVKDFAGLGLEIETIDTTTFDLD